MSNVPSVSFFKADFQTGSVSPAATGIAAIIAASQTGTQNAAASYARDDLAFDDFAEGPLVEYASYVLQVGGKNVVLVKTTTSVAATYSTLTKSVAGTSVVTAGATAPLDEYTPLVTIVAGGTIGVAGITYTYSLDGGDSVSGVLALGTASTLTIPSSGVSFALAAGTLLAGDSWTCFTTRPLASDSDLTAALEALRVTRLPWEGVLIDSSFDSSTVGLVDTWLAGLEAVGQFHFAILNTRHKNEPVPTAETESVFATAMTTLTASSASIRCFVGTDAGDYTSTMTGWSQPRPPGLFLMARAALIPVGEDPAFVGRGNLTGVSIASAKGSPRWHDEDLYPGLDAQRLVTLRSFPAGGSQGVYITNANVISPSGSDYVWMQHVRTMNLACGIVWQVLQKLLSVGVTTKPADPVTGNVYIAEADAAHIDGLCNQALVQPLKGQCTAFLFRMSRTDNLSANSADAVTAQLSIAAKKYLKKFLVTTTFVKSISIPQTPQS